MKKQLLFGLSALVVLTLFVLVGRHFLLGHAVENGHVSLARIALKLGADANRKIDATGRTLLLHVAAYGEIEMAALLLERGADIGAEDRFGHTAALEAARGWNRLPMLRFLVERGASLHVVTKREDAGAAHLHGLGNTLLHWARHAETAEYLLQQGLAATARNAYGQTPLFDSPEPALVPLLVKHGADVNARDNKGHTALTDLVCHTGAPQVELVKALLAAGADPRLGPGGRPAVACAEGRFQDGEWGEMWALLAGDSPEAARLLAEQKARDVVASALELPVGRHPDCEFHLGELAAPPGVPALMPRDPAQGCTRLQVVEGATATPSLRCRAGYYHLLVAADRKQPGVVLENLAPGADARQPLRDEHGAAARIRFDRRTVTGRLVWYHSRERISSLADAHVAQALTPVCVQETVVATVAGAGE